MLTLALLLAGLAHPTAPVVVGPRATANTRPAYRFSSHEPGVPAAKLRFRCSFDRRRLHACGRRYRQRLSVGRHLLRVRALDPAGRRSRVTKVRVRILPRTGPGLREIEVGGRPFSLAEANGSIWIANFLSGTVERLNPQTNRVVARIDVGGEPYGLAVAPDDLGREQRARFRRLHRSRHEQGRHARHGR
jgi:YVTN family beta-propeller protein